MKTKSIFSVFCLLFISSLLAVVYGFAAVPSLINYQGKLTTPQGALIDSTLPITFTIYEDSVGVDSLWSETQDSVVVRNGIFSVLLGSTNEIPDSVFDGTVRYLGIKLGDDSEMTPRGVIVSVGYAYKAEYADTAKYARVAVSDGDWSPDTSGINIYRLTGNVGIGTPSPEVKLEVAENIAYGATAIRVVNTNSSNNNGFAFETVHDNFSSIRIGPNWISMRDPADSTDAVTFNNYGPITAYFKRKVGIGTANPQGKLDLNGSLAVAGDQGSTGEVLTSQGTGANPVWSEVTAVPADNSVSQAKLKTAIGEVSCAGSATPQLTLPGGTYGFYPQIKSSAAVGNTWMSHISQKDNTVLTGWTTYLTTIAIWTEGGNTIYARQRYVTSSGKDHWMFFLLDSSTKQVLAGYQAPDHPCYSSGGDENDIPHPFGSYDPEKHEVILADNEVLQELKSKVTSKRSLLTIINEEYEIDFDSEPMYEPREIIEIDEYGDKEGEILQKIKTPEWAKIMIGKDEIYLKRRLVETLPDYISYKKLKPKSDAIAESQILSQSTGAKLDATSHK